MTRKRVVVVGGGLAGLAAGLACADAGARVLLLEARPRLGGATWSTRHQGLAIDNGQHVFLRCCTAYRDFARRLGVESRLALQPRLAVPVLAPGRSARWLRRHRLPAPLHLAPSLLRFGHLSARERVRAARTARALGALDLDDRRLDDTAFGDWLAARGESPRAVDAFWDLLVRPTLNLPAAEASLALAAKVFQTGLLERADAADIGWSREPLGRVHAEPAAAALAAAGAEVRLRARVDALEPRPDGGLAVRTRGARIPADAVVLAVEHEPAAELLPASAGVSKQALRALGRAPIVNLHVVYDRIVQPYELVAAIDSPVQWSFDRTRAAGLASGQYLAISLSSANAWVGLSSQRLRAVFEPALAALFPRARQARLLRFFATCERAATFAQRPGTWRHRPGTRTALPELALAGAWTDTRWPATMEGAVRSGVAAARQALLAVGMERALPAEAA